MKSQFIDFKVIIKLPFLRKVLQAVQLHYDKDILSLSGDAQLTFSISDLLTDTATSKVIVFGFPPSQIGLHLNLPKYQAHQVGPCTYLFADALSVLEQQASLKKLLWEGLQVLFK